ncbi:MAG: hypothetical protein R3194_14700, partial [Limnobacter sp.]|nr:hypothetical protein [Limnobacter sp.]
DLLSLCLKPNPAWKDLKQIVWFDDGEVLPGHWIDAYLPGIPVHREQLVLIAGPKPWQALVNDNHHRKVSLSMAADEHTQAHQAAATIVRWLGQSPDQEVVVAVSDRLAARRLSALLEGLNIQVDDRTGWRLSTAALAGWFDALLEDVQEQGEVSQVRHPFHGQAIASPHLPARPTEPLSLGLWAEFWLQCFTHWEVMADLQSDEAGRLIVHSLQSMTRLAASGLLNAATFRQACRFRLEHTRFKPKDVKSPVVFMPLQSTRLRTFSRVLVLGCAQSHFQESPPGLLPPSVAFDLGLPGSQLGRIQKMSALWDLIRYCDQVVVCHSQATLAGPEVLLP